MWVLLATCSVVAAFFLALAVLCCLFGYKLGMRRKNSSTPLHSKTVSTALEKERRHLAPSDNNAEQQRTSNNRDVVEAVPNPMPQLTIERLNFAPSPCVSERTEHVPLFLSQNEQLSRTNENRSSYGPSFHACARPSLTTDGPFMYAPTVGGMVVLAPSVLLGHDSIASAASRDSPSLSTDSNTTAVRHDPHTVTPPDSNVVDTSEYFTPVELLRERHRSSSRSPPPPLNTSGVMRMDATGCAVSFSRALDFSSSNATADYDDMAAENSWLDVSTAMLPTSDEVSPSTRPVVDDPASAEEEKENNENVGFFNGNPTGNFTSD